MINSARSVCLAVPLKALPRVHLSFVYLLKLKTINSISEQSWILFIELLPNKHIKTDDIPPQIVAHHCTGWMDGRPQYPKALRKLSLPPSIYLSRYRFVFCCCFALFTEVLVVSIYFYRSTTNTTRRPTPVHSYIHLYIHYVQCKYHIISFSHHATFRDNARAFVLLFLCSVLNAGLIIFISRDRIII